MLNQPRATEYLLSSNECHSIKEFIELACEYAELKYEWKNLETPLNTELWVNNKMIMNISKQFYRPAEVELLYGDSTESRKQLNWKPKTSFKQLVKKMVEHDIKLLVQT